MPRGRGSGARPNLRRAIDSLTYIGHATLLLELGAVRILTDPCLRRRIAHLRRRTTPPPLDSLADLDAIVVSHPHRDHLDLPSLRLVAADRRVIVPRGCGRLLRRKGIGQVVEVEVGDRIPVGEVTVEAVHADHDGRRYPIGRRRAALGFLFEGPSTIYFAGDTDLFAGMERLRGRVDIAALPVSGWGPRLPAGHLDPDRAAEAVALIEPRIAVPIHWGTLAAIGGARRGGRKDAGAFAAAVARIAPDTRVPLLDPNQRLVLDPAHDDDPRPQA